MELTHAIVLAILQGLTEFLPISSSGHLILVPALLGWEDQGLAFDIAVHFGSLIAVVSYFRADIFAMAKAVTQPSDPNAQLAWKIVIATIPLGLAGLIFADFVEANLRSPMIIATTTAVFGIALWVADRAGRRSGTEYTMGWRIAIGIGLAQVLALIPGTSRSGITMTAALALGLNREAAGRFSFLLSIPAILMASGWQSLNLIGADLVIDWGQLLVASTVSAVVAFVTIALFLKLISRMGMAWFAVYRILLAAVIVYVLA
jgi:undecaprenyl-diphosphatase